MAKVYKPKGVHTSPETAGEQNFVGKDLPKDEGINAQIYPAYKHGLISGYTGQWTDEQFSQSIVDFFDYCVEKNVKPTQPLLRLWLNVSKSQMNDWKSQPLKYGGKSVILQKALDFMEAYLQSNMDKYPTGSIFLLKSTHGHEDKNTIEVQGSNPTEIKDTISKLGLDKE